MQSTREFIKFCVAGGINSSVMLVTYYICLAAGILPMLANGLGYLVSLISAYLLNRRWVFRARGVSVRKSSFKFLAVYLGTFCLNNLVVFISLYVLKIHRYIAPVLGILFNVPINFLLNKFWTFKQ